MMSLMFGVSGGVIRVRAMLAGTEELPDFTDSGMLDRTDALPKKEGEREGKPFYQM